MTTTGTGVVEVYAVYGNLKADPIAFTVTSGGTPERMLSLSVIAADEAGHRVPGVNVEITPERGVRQTCQTSATGFCGGWVLDTPIQVTGTKAGFLPAQAAGYAPFPDSLIRQADLVMRPQ